MSVFVWIGIGTVAASLLADIGYRRFAAERIQSIIENVPTFAAVPTPPVPDVETFRIPTRDGLCLDACLHLPRSKPAGIVLFCPELNGNHWTALHYGQALLDSGFVILGFDFRNQGASDRQNGYAPIHWVTEFELTDIRAVLDYVEGNPNLSHLPVGIFGVSRGGSAALMAAGRFPEIKAVATDSAFDTLPLIRNFMNKFSRFVVPDWFFRKLPDWHIELVLRQALSASEKARHCRYLHLERESLLFDKPALLVSGSRDSFVTPAVTLEVEKSLGAACSTWIVQKAKHNKARERERSSYDDRLVAHFVTSLMVDSRDASPTNSFLRSSKVA